MPNWRIEPARTGRGTCKACQKPIKEGELRFGQDTKTASWFHLAKCAEQGAPRAFKPFAAQAAELLAKGWKTAGPAAASKKLLRNPTLEKALVADPADEAGKSVYADWLQSQGDWWGELIALAQSGDQDAWKKAVKPRLPALTGGLSSTKWLSLTWRSGFIDSAYVFSQRKPSVVIPVLETLFSLRASLVLRKLGFEFATGRELVSFLAKALPSTVKDLRLPYCEGFSALAGAGVEELMIDDIDEHDPSDLAKLGEKGRLPRLRRLDLYDANDAAIVEAVLSSPAAPGLELLWITGDLPPAAVDLLVRQKGRLKNLKTLAYDPPRDTFPRALEKAFGSRLRTTGDVLEEDLDREHEDDEDEID